LGGVRIYVILLFRKYVVCLGCMLDVPMWDAKYPSEVRRGGLAWFAPVCSSWVRMGVSKTKRSKLFPLGERPRSQKVIDANITVLSVRSRVRANYFVTPWTNMRVIW
jgi:hypothetical protein